MADRICSKCGHAKPETINFFQSYVTSSGIMLLRYVCRICRGCKNEGNNRPLKQFGRSVDDKRELDKQRCSKYYRLNKEKSKEYYKNQRLLNPEKFRSRDRRYYVKNKANKEYQRIRWKQIQRYPETLMASRSRRRAKQVGASGNYTKADVKELLQRQHGTCFYCFNKFTTFHVDHFIPLARGGSNGPENLVLSCPSCNFRKGAKMPWEWMSNLGQSHG